MTETDGDHKGRGTVSLMPVRASEANASHFPRTHNNPRNSVLPPEPDIPSQNPRMSPVPIIALRTQYHALRTQYSALRTPSADWKLRNSMLNMSTSWYSEAEYLPG